MHYSPRSRSTLFGARVFSASGPDTRSGVRRSPDCGPSFDLSASLPATGSASLDLTLPCPTASKRRDALSGCGLKPLPQGPGVVGHEFRPVPAPG